jgi:histidine decarboxylase
MSAIRNMQVAAAEGQAATTEVLQPDPAEVIAGAVSPYRNYHVGFRGSGSYIAAPFTVAVVRPAERDLTAGLNRILGFDLAEARAGVGLVNAWMVSSFCSPDEGAIPGVDLLPCSSCDSCELFSVLRHDGEMIPVHPMYPALDAAAAMLHHWEFRDGSFVPFAMKNTTVTGPAVIGAVLGIGIPADPAHARLFMEDPAADTPAGYYELLAADAEAHGRRIRPPADRDALPGRISRFYRRARLRAAARSVIEIGAQRGRLFSRVLVGGDFAIVPEEGVGCAMAAAAYLQFAQQAIPSGGPAQMVDMTCKEWLADCLP